ncbi:MAG: RtcB family protein, partial [Clostridia bacterium]
QAVISAARQILGRAFEADLEAVNCHHNYVQRERHFGHDILVTRKGAVSAKVGETLIIPMNMRDGSLICKGKGNADWNFSAPHGAGRLMSRTVAKERMTLAEYAQSMEGIYTTSVNQQTIDEAPDAYKPMAEIVENVADTVEIMSIIKPIYNFKAGE